MPNPGQPTVHEGANNLDVRSLQRALRRTPNADLVVDGFFGPKTKTAVEAFQHSADLPSDGVVGDQTWRALPDSSPMPVLPEGSKGKVVRDLQRVLTEGAPGHWEVTPGEIDGKFGPHTRESVEHFQKWAKVTVDGVVGDQTWAMSLPDDGGTLETMVGIEHVTSPPPKTIPRPRWAWAVCIGAIVSFVMGLWLYNAHVPKMNMVSIEIGGHGQPWPLPAGTLSALAWDYPFILCYGLALWLGTTAARWVFWSPRSATLARLARGATMVVVLADLAENLCLTLALNGAGPARSTFESRALDGAAIAATIKFAVLVPAAAMAVVGVAVAIGRLISSRVTHNHWPVGRVVLPAATEYQRPTVQPKVPLQDRLYRTIPARESEPPAAAPSEPRWRHAYAVPDITPETLSAKAHTGFCLSGGGIRSGSVAMGALQTLRRELCEADYLVSISGGGYTAGAFAQLLTEAGDSDFGQYLRSGRVVHDPAGAFMPGSVELDHIRRHSSYIATTATEMLVALAVLARGLIATLLLLFAPAVALGVGAAWFFYAIPLGVFPFDALPRQNAVLAAVLVTGLALLAWLVQIATVSSLTNWGNDPDNVGQRTQLLSSHGFFITFGQRAYGWSRSASVFLTQIAVIIAVIAVGVPTLVWACEHIVGPVNPGTGFGGSLSAALLTYLAAIASIGWRRRKTIQKAVGDVAGKGGGATQKAAVPTGLLQLLLVIASVGVLCASWLMLFGVAAVGTVPDLAAGRFSPSIMYGLGAVLVVVVIGALFDETSLSLHPFYRRRLASAFATRAVTVPGPDPESDSRQVAVPYTAGELTPLSKYARAAGTFPEFIFAASANLTGEDRTPPGLNAVSFTMSAEWVGGPDVGWVHTETLEKACPPRLRRDVTVQAAVAISGAAFASAMGRFASWYQIVLAVSGARLGAWLPNPVFLGAMQAAQQGGRVTDWTLPGLPSIRRATYLLRELFNIHPAQERLLQVTDGGHYENLGIVELLRRRCTTIYCIDGGGDSPPTAPGLAEAMALAYTELGVQIELIDPFTAEPGAGDPLEPLTSLAALNATLTREPVIKGTITYPPASGLPENSRTGFIYIARALLWPEMSYPLLSYAAQNPVFPHDSTGDQWFDDDQFTAYTQLGRELGEVVQQVRDVPRTRRNRGDGGPAPWIKRALPGEFSGSKAAQRLPHLRHHTNGNDH
jgi:Putative peptidoglycan binding domain